MRFVISALRPFVWLFCRIVFRIEYHGVDNVPAEGACVITPNHVTYADPIWITIPIKRRIFFMAWDKPFEIPILGSLMRVFGAFPVKLETIDTSAHRSAKRALANGRALVMFPEAGRSKTGELMPFKLGAFRMALMYGVPVVPVTIKGAFEIWPVGRLLPRPGKLTVIYHPPIPVELAEPDINRSELKARSASLARRTQEVIASALGQVGISEGEGDAAVPFETRA